MKAPTAAQVGVRAGPGHGTPTHSGASPHQHAGQPLAPAQHAPHAEPHRAAHLQPLAAASLRLYRPVDGVKNKRGSTLTAFCHPLKGNRLDRFRKKHECMFHSEEASAARGSTSSSIPPAGRAQPPAQPTSKAAGKRASVPYKRPAPPAPPAPQPKHPKATATPWEQIKSPKGRASATPTQDRHTYESLSARREAGKKVQEQAATEKAAKKRMSSAGSTPRPI